MARNCEPCWDPCPPLKCGQRSKHSKQDEPEDFPNIPSNAQRTILEDEAKESRDFVMREEFLKRTTDKSIFNEIKRLVNCAKAAQENDLNKKRERLRKLLTDEEMRFEAEFKAAMGRRIDNDIELRRNHLLSLKVEREEKRKRFVEEKRMQQLIARCDVVRPLLEKQMLDESKRVQLIQIEERKALKAMAKDFDNLWHSVGMKRQQELEREEEEKNRLAYMNAKCVQEEWKKQMIEQKERERVARLHLYPAGCCVKGEIFPIDKMEEKEEKEERRIRNVQHAQDLIAQQEEKRLIKQREKKAEDDFDAVVLATCRSEIAKEELTMKSNKKTLMKETWQYLNYLQELQCERKMNEAELDKLLVEINRQMESGANHRCAEQRKKREFEKLVHAERRQQIEQRALDRCKECNNRICEAIIEREINSRELEEDRLKAANKLKQNIEFAKGLLQQSAVTKKRNKDAEQLSLDQAAKTAKEEEIQCEKVAEMIRQGQTLNLFAQHPNKWWLDNHHKFV